MKKNCWPGKFILVEGLDGSGKTTAMKAAIGNLNQNGARKINYIKGMGGRNFWGRLAKRYAKTFLFLFELVYLTYFEILPRLRREEILLVDKYYFFVASHIPDVDTRLNRFLLGFFEKWMIRPDKVIYFEVALEERIARLMAGEPSRFHKKLIDSPDWILKRDKRYVDVVKKCKIDPVYFDSTGMGKEEMVAQFKKLLKGILGGDK